MVVSLMLRTALAVFLAMSVSVNGFAMEWTVDAYRKAIGKGEPDRSVVLMWLDGVYSGFLWANAELGLDKKPLLFCAPGKMAMSVEQIQLILDGTAVRFTKPTSAGSV